MLSPAQLSRLLSSTLAGDPGPHTALLVTPQGQLLAAETNYESNEEPYLDPPERFRLLCGLASQWEDDESPRIECELGRLLLHPFNLQSDARIGGNASGILLVLNGSSQTPWTSMIQMLDQFNDQWMH